MFNRRIIVEKLKRHSNFWGMASVKRPLVCAQLGIELLSDNWCPVYGNQHYTEGKLSPDLIVPEDHKELYNLAVEARSKIIDDSVPIISPLLSIPWMEGLIGCNLLIRDGRVWAKYEHEEFPNIDYLYGLLVDSNQWLLKYTEFLTMFKKHFPGYAVGQSLLRGPTDLVGILCGSTGHLLNLYDKPDYMRELLQFCAHALIWFAKKTLLDTPTFNDGYCLSGYNLWAPGTCIRFQEDFTSLYSPRFYTKFVVALDSKIAKSFDYSVFHMHTSQLHLINLIVEDPNLKTVQITRDINFNDLEELIKAARLIQSKNKRLILRGPYSEEDIYRFSTQLSPVGLYIQNVIRIDELNALTETMIKTWN